MQKQKSSQTKNLLGSAWGPGARQEGGHHRSRTGSGGAGAPRFTRFGLQGFAGFGFNVAEVLSDFGDSELRA